MKDVANNLIIALQSVIEDWDIVELFFVILFFPFSILYMAMRMVQEYEK